MDFATQRLQPQIVTEKDAFSNFAQCRQGLVRRVLHVATSEAAHIDSACADPSRKAVANLISRRTAPQYSSHWIGASGSPGMCAYGSPSLLGRGRYRRCSLRCLRRGSSSKPRGNKRRSPPRSARGIHVVLLDVHLRLVAQHPSIVAATSDDEQDLSCE